MAKLKNIHPGEILQEEFLLPFNVSAYKLAKDVNIPQQEFQRSLKETEESLLTPPYV